MSEPINTNGNGGRRGNGTFAPGHKFAKGNPNNAKAQKLRNAALRAVTRGDITAIMRKMVEQAKAGDAVAAKFVCDRVLGKTSREDVVERIERLEAMQQQGGRTWK